MSTRVKPERYLISYKYRSLKNMDWSHWTSFHEDITCSLLNTEPEVDEFADQLDSVTMITKFSIVAC